MEKKRAIKSIIISVIINTIIISSEDLDTFKRLSNSEQNIQQKTRATTSAPINVTISQEVDLKKAIKKAKNSQSKTSQKLKLANNIGLNYLKKKMINLKDSIGLNRSTSIPRADGIIEKVGSVHIMSSENKKLDRNKHYSFYYRILETYLNQVNLQFYDLVSSKKMKQNEAMIGQIIFDRQGNAQKLKILKWARDDLVHETFLKTMKGIQKIQNIPSDLLSKDDGFTVYYRLNISL